MNKELKKRIEFREGCHKFCSCEMLFIDGVAVVDNEDLEVLFDFIFAQKQEIKEMIENYLTQWLKDFANRPLELREGPFHEVVKIRKDIIDEIKKLRKKK